MTELGKKTKQTKRSGAQGGVMANARKKPRQTAHRLAISKPEVQEGIKRLRKRWRFAKTKERRERIADLLNKGCTVRGLADAIDKPESVVRYYSKRARNSREEGKQEARETYICTTGGPMTTSSATTPGKLAPVPSNDQSDKTRRPQVSSGKRSMTVPPLRLESPKKPFPARTIPERKEKLESLKRRLPKIIIEFIRSKLGSPDSPARIAELQILLSSLRTHLKAQVPWVCPRQLPNPITVSQLYELTRLNFGNEQSDADELGKWLAVLVVSLDPCGTSWNREIEEAERELISEPDEGNTPPPESEHQRPFVSATFTESGADRNRGRVPSRTEAFRGGQSPYQLPKWKSQ